MTTFPINVLLPCHRGERGYRVEGNGTVGGFGGALG